MRDWTGEERRFDVLVLGAGGAGLRAAIELGNAGLSVGVISKSLLGKAHTVMAEGGIAAALGSLDAADGWLPHFQDTMRSGHFINDYRAALLLAREAPERVAELEAWGALFDRTDEGRIMQRSFGAHTYRRLCHVADRTGLELLRTLQTKALGIGIEVLSEVAAVALLRDGDRLAGAVTYDRNSGTFLLLHAPAAILATGGWGRVYGVTSNSWEGTGEGIAIAYMAGAELRDMEMVQFHPTGMVWPPSVRGLLVTEGVRGEGGLLLNAQGRRFMEDYDPQRMELSTRDVVARAIYQEVRAGRGTPHGGVWLDVTHLGAARIRQKLPTMVAQFHSLADIDITREPFEVAPTVHYMMGGVRTDPFTAATSVPGLFAAGEVASGVHGANRLGGNSLADLLVFGRRAGLAASEYVQGLSSRPEPDRREAEARAEHALVPLLRTGGPNAHALQRELTAIMDAHAAIVRDGPGLRRGLQQLLDLRERASSVSAPGPRGFNPGWHAAIELEAMLLMGEAILRSALLRRESRGSHWRTDHPEERPEWGLLNVLVRRQGERMAVGTAPVPVLPPDLQTASERGAPGAG